jgi:LacI family gluconate utilization system Gnt-I transcriptional repressor
MTETGSAMLRRAGVTVVETWDLPAAPIDAVVGFDNHATGEAVARHFVASGRHRLGFVGGSDTRSERRWAGFVAATRTAGLAMPHRITVPVVASAEAAAALVPALGEVDAIFATTDVYALGLLSGLHRAGRRVPDDVALVGLGDLEMARLASPALSSVRIDGRAIGQAAAKLILGAKGPRYIDLGFELVLRESA